MDLILFGGVTDVVGSFIEILSVGPLKTNAIERLNVLNEIYGGVL